MIADLSLKINTFSLYFEQLLNNLKNGLHDTFHRIGNDMRQIFNNRHFYSSNLDALTENTPTDSSSHAQVTQTPTPQVSTETHPISSFCKAQSIPSPLDSPLASCDYTPEKEKDLEIHLHSHGTSQSYSCDNCDKVFRKSSELQMHNRSEHGTNNDKILQVDGLDLDLFDFDDSLPSGSVRHANYALNQTKQTTKTSWG